MPRGCLMTLEGIDGAGKSSHIEWLRAHLQRQGIGVITTREPGGTALGERLRELLLQEPMHLETETLLMFAARREHLATVIEPALDAGQWVICDRFSDASHAYQGGGRGLHSERITTLEHWVHARLQPDLTLLFDVPVQVARERIVRATRLPDRFEQETTNFHERVRHAYLERARQQPRRIRVLDGTRSLQAIQQSLQDILSPFVAAHPGASGTPELDHQSP